MGESKGDYYFIYPDPLVYFAYKIPKYNASLNPRDEIKRIATTVEGQIRKILPQSLIKQLESPDKFLLVFDIFSESNTKELLNDIGYLQFLLAAHPTIMPPTFIANKIHLGSPHLFYRWLASRDDDDPIEYQLVNSKPIYPTKILSNYGSKTRFLPLDNNVTLIAGNIPDLVPIPDSVTSPYSPAWSGTYCGDVRKYWEQAYEHGKAGNFEKCRELYNRQFPFRLYPKSTSKISNMAPSVHRLGDLRRVSSALKYKVLQKIL